MKAETIYSDDVLESIDIKQKAILDIRMSYLKEIDLSSAMGNQRVERIIKNMKTDLRIELLKKEIFDIYTHAVPKIIVTAETETEREALKERLVFNEFN